MPAAVSASSCRSRDCICGRSGRVRGQGGGGEYRHLGKEVASMLVGGGEAVQPSGGIVGGYSAVGCRVGGDQRGSPVAEGVCMKMAIEDGQRALVHGGEASVLQQQR